MLQLGTSRAFSARLLNFETLTAKIRKYESQDAEGAKGSTLKRKNTTQQRLIQSRKRIHDEMFDELPEWLMQSSWLFNFFYLNPTQLGSKNSLNEWLKIT